MQYRDIKRLLDAVTEAELTEFTLETGDWKMSLRRGSPAQVQPVARQETAAPVPASSPVEPAAPAAAEAESPAVVAALDPKLIDVVAPIVGTFYAASAPDRDDYVKVGDRVTRGTVLCIIEAMKLMNEIEAEVAGTVVELLVRNEDPVEYGQPLLRIAPG